MGQWKVEALWKKNYHSWKQSLLARHAKKTMTLLCTGDSNDGSELKQKEPPEPVDCLSKTEDLLDVP
jgi:hypothetical protein